MQDTITIAGCVGTAPSLVTLPGGTEAADFRLASTRRKRDDATGTWSDAGTNWYTVKAYGRLAANVAASVSSGQRIVVVGRLRVRSWEKDGRSGSALEVIADAVGHDLTWGTAVFARPKGGAAALADDDVFPDPGPDLDDNLAGADDALVPAEEIPVPF